MIAPLRFKLNVKAPLQNQLIQTMSFALRGTIAQFTKGADARKGLWLRELL